MLLALPGPWISNLGLSLTSKENKRKRLGSWDSELRNQTTWVQIPGQPLSNYVTSASYLPQHASVFLSAKWQWIEHLPHRILSIQWVNIFQGCRTVLGWELNSHCHLNGQRGAWERLQMSAVLSLGHLLRLPQFLLIRAELASHWFFSPKAITLEAWCWSLSGYFFLRLKQKRGFKWLFSQLLYLPQGKNFNKLEHSSNWVPLRVQIYLL